MKKPARKKISKEKEEISQLVAEIVEENEKEQEDEVEKEVNEVHEPDPVKEDNDDAIGDEDQTPSSAENAQNTSFYERVMGEKPPERKEEVYDEVTKERSINAKLFLLGAFVFVLTVLISSLVGLSILNKDIIIKRIGIKPTVTPTPIPSTPTPIAFAREGWTFEVLNGSSTPGLAAKASEKIRSLGYKVDKVGNADESVDTTQVLVSTDANDKEKDMILKDLKTDFGDLRITDTLSGLKKTVRIILAK